MADDNFLDPNPLMDDTLILRLVYDIATGIYVDAGDDLAIRYGFPDDAALRRYLARHPKIVQNAMKAKAIMESDESLETRVRLKAMHATENLITPTANIAGDARVAPQQRIDAFKQLSRVSGLDSAAKNADASGGPAFTLNILFRKNPAEVLELTPEKPVPAFNPLSITPGVIGGGEDDDDEDV